MKQLVSQNGPIQDKDLFQPTDPTAGVVIFILYLIKEAEPPSKMFVFQPFHDQWDMYVPLTKSLFKSAGITVSHFFSTLPSTLKYLYSVKPVRVRFPVKQQCTNDTVCNVAMQHCTLLFRWKMHSDWFNRIEILQGRWQHGEKVGCCYPSGLEKTLCKWDIYV
jgi:hypothetical protein